MPPIYMPTIDLRKLDVTKCTAMGQQENTYGNVCHRPNVMTGEAAMCCPRAALEPAYTQHATMSNIDM